MIAARGPDEPLPAWDPVALKHPAYHREEHEVRVVGANG